MTKEFDLVVIGAGSGGVRCARVAASLGAKVAVIESRYLGGTCVNVGCVPKKLFVYASQYKDLVDQANGFGWDIDIKGFKWNTLVENKTQEIERLNFIYQQMLEKQGVEIFRGHGKIIDGHTVSVDNKIHLKTKYILIATGGWPRKGAYPGANLTVTSNEVFNLDALPKRVLVEGGGYIATEFAGIFNGLGCDTRLAYRGSLFLRGFDKDARAFLADQIREKGIELDFNSEIASLAKLENGALSVQFKDGRTDEVDMVFSAIGRVPMTENLGLENTKVSFDERGYLVVSENYQTSEPSIYAVGDVVGKMPLTPVALNEGSVVAHQLFSRDAKSVSYKNVPSAIFTQPEMACVGLTEEQARSTLGEVTVFKSDFKPLKHTLSGQAERTLVKLIVETKSQRVVGCHMVGEHASEIMQGVAMPLI